MELESADLGPLDDLVPLMMHEFRAMAHRELRREHGQPTLQTTDLVHEAYLRLSSGKDVTRHGRAYFYAAAGRAMRQVLVDAARRRCAAKRGGGQVPASLTDVAAPDDGYAAEVLELNQALAALAGSHPRAARTVECRYFGGMSVEDTAEALGVSPRTIKADWALARAWLAAALDASAA